jgi:UDP-N-acetyl-D-galactosamine dehydrogenase
LAKAQEAGYHPEIILCRKKHFRQYGEYVASRIVKLMIKSEFQTHSETIMLGITFKENCPDVRNTKIVDVIKALADYGIEVTI